MGACPGPAVLTPLTEAPPPASSLFLKLADALSLHVASSLKVGESVHVVMAIEIRSVQRLVFRLGIATLLALDWVDETRAAELDPKTACRTEEVIIKLAGVPPDKLDFLGERQGPDAFRCDAYFSFAVYDEVWNRLNELAKTLRDVEGMCVINGLAKLPRIGALQIEYVINASGQLQIKSVSEGLPTNPQKLSQRLRADIGRLTKIRDANDMAIRDEYVRRSCPEAEYPSKTEQ